MTLYAFTFGVGCIVALDLWALGVYRREVRRAEEIRAEARKWGAWR